MDFTKLNHDVVFKRSNNKIIWQPRIISWYYDRKHGGENRLPEKYKDMSLKEIYVDLGCSNRVYEYNACFTKVEDSRVKRTRINHEKHLYEDICETPVGTINQIVQTNSSNYGTYPKKWWVETAEDLEVVMWLEENSHIEFSQEKYNEVEALWGNLGAPQIFFDYVSIQKLYIQLMGVTNTIYALSDFPEVIERYFEVLHRKQMESISVYATSPIKIINYGDNVHNGTLSPRLFKKYVLKCYQERSDEFHKYGCFVNAHWDGDTKYILKYAQETRMDGIEAITPLPQGDVTLEEMKAGLGDMIMMDGIPAVLFDKTFPVEQLVETTHKIIELFAPNLVLGISDEMSSTGDIERIRIVGKIVDEYNKQFE